MTHNTALALSRLPEAVPTESLRGAFLALVWDDSREAESAIARIGAELTTRRALHVARVVVISD